MKIMFIVNDLGVNEPFGPMALSAVLKNIGHETTLGVIKKGDVEEKIRAWQPDMLAYSMMSVDMRDMKKFNDHLRKKVKLFTLLGGAGPSFDRSCVDDPGIDAVCVGEGEDALIEITKRFEQHKRFEDIPNIIARSAKKLTLRHLIEDFDKYPFMDRELVYAYPEMRHFGIKGIWTSRGCIFPCPYCFNNRYNELFKESGRIVRRRSVDSVIKETKQLISRYRTAFIRIQDDVFVHKADEWLKEFSVRWASEICLPFYCLLRAEFITDEMALGLKKAGCASVGMSIEAADDEVRNRMMRRHVSKAQLENAFRILKKYKIRVYTNTMLALPFTTLEHDIASLDFSIKIKPDMPNFSIFMPYPGTDLGDYCKKAGIYDPVRETIDFGMRNMSPLSCFSAKEKIAQYNLCQLAIVGVKFPLLRNFIVNHLIHWKPNPLFFLVHYVIAVLSFGRRIFYFKHSFTEYYALVKMTLRHYFYDFTKRGKKSFSSIQSTAPFCAIRNDKTRSRELEICMKAMSEFKAHK